MKPGPEHVGMLFQFKDGRRAHLIDLRNDGVRLRSVTGEISPVIPHAEFERDWSLPPSAPTPEFPAMGSRESSLLEVTIGGIPLARLSATAQGELVAWCQSVDGREVAMRAAMPDQFAVIGGAQRTALLSRLLAAGFDQAEISLFRSKDLPAPILRFRGVVGDEWISYDQIDPGDGDLGRIEAAVMGKLEVRKATRAGKEKNES